MKIYAIANTTNECYGHGDYGSVTNIRRQGSYNSGDFPPAFTSREAADKYHASLPWPNGFVVVELELVVSMTSH